MIVIPIVVLLFFLFWWLYPLVQPSLVSFWVPRQHRVKMVRSVAK